MRARLCARLLSQARRRAPLCKRSESWGRRMPVERRLCPGCTGRCVAGYVARVPTWTAARVDTGRAMGPVAYGEVGRLVVDGVYCEVAGSGPPVVLTHDGLLHSESWDAQFEVFAAGSRVARWDRRGYGRSPRPTAPFSSIDDLAAVVRGVSDSPATVIGCSYGALLSMHCALDHPRLIAALVLVGPIVSGLPLSEHFQTRGDGAVPAFGAPLAEQIAYWSGSDRWFVAPANTAARQRLHALLSANPHNLRLARELELRPQPPALPRLGEIAVPTLIVVGEQDIPDVHAHCGAIEAAIPGATRVVLPGSGHLPHLETPEVFNRVVHEFLDRGPRTSAGRLAHPTPQARPGGLDPPRRALPRPRRGEQHAPARDVTVFGPSGTVALLSAGCVDLLAGAV